ncbi:MAG: linalool dehydratase/isomerase domain-containing protein [Candidatus Hodarchaeales archaeon]|jgi:hypothetical protein
MSSKAIDFIFQSKLFISLFIVALIVSGSTFLLAPVAHPTPHFGKIQVGDETFDLSKYPYLERKVIGMINSQREVYDVTNLLNESINDLSILPDILTHYFLAFTVDAMAQICDTTPNYRTKYYTELFDKIILMMNSSAIEHYEWIRTGYGDEYYANVGNGFRGPTNIMWTGHYTMMELLYYNVFRDDRYNEEIKWFMDDWNSSLTTTTTWDNKTSIDDQGRPLGRWGTGMIPCEPYIVFVQCNSIPIYTVSMYDKLHDSNYRQAFDPGIDWWQQHMTDNNGIQIDGYYVIEPYDPTASMLDPDYQKPEFPGPALTRGTETPKVSSYGSTWACMLYQAFGETDIASKYYQTWKDLCVHYTTDNMAYAPDSYHRPNSFSQFDLMGAIFAYVASREMQDWDLFRKLENFFFNPFPSYWERYQYKFDSTILGSFLAPLFHPVFNMAYTWGHAGSNLADLMDPRPDSFFNSIPYISDENTTEGLFVYQAIYDESKEAFILSVEANENTQLTFDNFPEVTGIFMKSGGYKDWSQEGDQMFLNLSPGTYSFVILRYPLL